jgi:hypothetical protein
MLYSVVILLGLYSLRYVNSLLLIVGKSRVEELQVKFLVNASSVRAHN